MTLYPEASLERIEAAHEEQPHLEVSVGESEAITGLRVGFVGVEGVGTSLPKKVPVHTLQFALF